jgi:hypothetical protein
MVMALLAVAAGVLSLKMETYPMVFGIGAVCFMALNALGALYPLYHFKGNKNPFNIYLMGMIVRLGVVGIALIRHYFRQLEQSRLTLHSVNGNVFLHRLSDGGAPPLHPS